MSRASSPPARLWRGDSHCDFVLRGKETRGGRVRCRARVRAASVDRASGRLRCHGARRTASATRAGWRRAARECGRLEASSRAMRRRHGTVIGSGRNRRREPLGLRATFAGSVLACSGVPPDRSSSIVCRRSSVCQRETIVRRSRRARRVGDAAQGTNSRTRDGNSSIDVGVSPRGSPSICSGAAPSMRTEFVLRRLRLWSARMRPQRPRQA